MKKKPEKRNDLQAWAARMAEKGGKTRWTKPISKYKSVKVKDLPAAFIHHCIHGFMIVHQFDFLQLRYHLIDAGIDFDKKGWQTIETYCKEIANV